MSTLSKLHRAVLGGIGAMLVAISLVTPGLAADTVTQVITGNGALSASVANASMGSIAYSNAAGSTTGTLTLTVDDPRGTSAGWNVTIQSGDFIYGGAANASAQDLPASGFAITTVNTPTVIAGQAVGVGGPLAVGAAAASLDVARTPIRANAGYGSGSYSQTLPVSLAIPALSQAGTYTATLTVSITSGP
jgi:hypothetical protein